MIVSTQNDQLQLVTQVEHALVSGDLCRHWGNAAFKYPSPYDSVCFGTSRHDEGWRSPDQYPFFDSGRGQPLNFFEVDLREHMKFYREGVDRLVKDDLYAALLAGMHWIGLYRDRWGFQPGLTRLSDQVRSAIDAVVAEEEQRWLDWKRRLWTPKERRSTFEQNLWMHYDLLQVWDAVSLYLCMANHDEPSERIIGPTPVGLDNQTVDIHVRCKGGRVVTMDPYPFAEPAVVVDIPVRNIPNIHYESQASFQKAYETAKVSSLQLTIQPEGVAQ